MPVETPSLFARAIEDHLELKRRNAELEGDLALEHYKNGDPFANHPLFKTEEQARLEETVDGVAAPEVEMAKLRWPGEADEQELSSEESLWSRSRDFDWGD